MYQTTVDLLVGFAWPIAIVVVTLVFRRQLRERLLYSQLSFKRGENTITVATIEQAYEKRRTLLSKLQPDSVADDATAVKDVTRSHYPTNVSPGDSYIPPDPGRGDADPPTAAEVPRHDQHADDVVRPSAAAAAPADVLHAADEYARSSAGLAVELRTSADRTAIREKLRELARHIADLEADSTEAMSHGQFERYSAIATMLSDVRDEYQFFRHYL